MPKKDAKKKKKLQVDVQHEEPEEQIPKQNHLPIQKHVIPAPQMPLIVHQGFPIQQQHPPVLMHTQQYPFNPEQLQNQLRQVYAQQSLPVQRQYENAQGPLNQEKQQHQVILGQGTNIQPVQIQHQNGPIVGPPTQGPHNQEQEQHQVIPGGAPEGPLVRDQQNAPGNVPPPEGPPNEQQQNQDIIGQPPDGQLVHNQQNAPGYLPLPQGQPNQDQLKQLIPGHTQQGAHAVGQQNALVYVPQGLPNQQQQLNHFILGHTQGPQQLNPLTHGLMQRGPSYPMNYQLQHAVGQQQPFFPFNRQELSANFQTQIPLLLGPHVYQQQHSYQPMQFANLQMTQGQQIPQQLPFFPYDNQQQVQLASQQVNKFYIVFKSVFLRVSK